jgi:DNA-binding response OmpR family regulator
MHQMAPAVPIIVVNALDAEVDVVLGLELGASDYVTKPYRQRELTARIQSVLHRARPPLVTSAVDTDVDRNRSEVIEAGPVSVNVGRREA